MSIMLTCKSLLLLAGCSSLVAGHLTGEQVPLLQNADAPVPVPVHLSGGPEFLQQASLNTAALHDALNLYPDPVEAFLSLEPSYGEAFAQPRLLQIFGEAEPRWMTEGDKLRLRRSGKKFMDVTEYEDVYEEQDQLATLSGKGNAHLPNLIHQSLIKPLFPQVSTKEMRHILKHMTSYYNRWYGGIIGEQSAQWLHDHIASIIKAAPFHTHISLEFFPHPFPQPSIIARFEPRIRNSSLPLTILGAHQDSANYLFPLLPAPGADDDCSGTVSILEAFRVLAMHGYTPRNGPVEFHFYAAEEGGLLGSQRIAHDYKASNKNIGAMLEFDMTAYIARNATESIGLIKTHADDALTEWLGKLGKEYISIPTDIYELGPNAGSDYMSFTNLHYPAAFASEGNPLANGGFPGDYDPYVHTANDTMDIDDEGGVFSIDAGWDNTWR